MTKKNYEKLRCKFFVEIFSIENYLSVMGALSVFVCVQNSCTRDQKQIEDRDASYLRDANGYWVAILDYAILILWTPYSRRVSRLRSATFHRHWVGKQALSNYEDNFESPKYNSNDFKKTFKVLYQFLERFSRQKHTILDTNLVQFSAEILTLKLMRGLAVPLEKLTRLFVFHRSVAHSYRCPLHPFISLGRTLLSKSFAIAAVKANHVACMTTCLFLQWSQYYSLYEPVATVPSFHGTEKTVAMIASFSDTQKA